MDVKNTVTSAVSAPPNESALNPDTAPPLSLFTRLSYAVRVWAFKTFVTTVLFLLRLVQASKFRAIAPTYTKRYPIRPMLESRVFLPKSYTSGTKLPLYIDIHGGGFTIADPATDDHFCRYFADTFEYCVVSIDYRKAPSAPFPVPVYDCAELVRAVLADGDLPVDLNKVALGGFSAGGNLSLAVAQFKDLKGKIKAVVPIYPVTDFTSRSRREYKPNKEGKEDVLKSMSKLFNWAYVPRDVDRRNTLLSSAYATRDILPQKMYIVGSEYDSLCDEAKLTAKRLAGIENEPDRGPEWSVNGIRWEMVHDTQHGFTHMELKGNEEIKRLKICHDLYRRIDAWIKLEAFQN